MPPSDQAELGLKLPAPAISLRDIERLVNVLTDGKGWMTAQELALRMYGLGNEPLKRQVRAIASAARPRVVSFPGSPGYKLWERCTVEEIRHGIASLESQGSGMIKDANVYRVALHRGFRGSKKVP